MSTPQIDWDAIAEKFDMWLPQIAPVGQNILERVQVNSGERVLDVASGTGEPALTLAGQCPGAEIIGTDAAPGMVRAATSKATAQGLSNLRFESMPAEALDFADASFDVVICRFGVMLFEDSQKGLEEMCRVLKPGGRFALSVWHTAETMPFMNNMQRVLKGRIDDEILPPLDKLVSIGEQAVLDPMLQEAGFGERHFSVEKIYYEFPSFDAFWETVQASQMLKIQLEALDPSHHPMIREELAGLCSEYVTAQGFRAPHHYLLAWGHR